MDLINFRNNDKKEHSSLIEKVCENLALPESTFLGTRITKKMLIDNNELSSADKKLVTVVIQSIEWQNTLKPETINIPVYVTDTVEYIEIAVIRVVLKNDIKNKAKLKNVAKLLHTLIPYPVILLLEIGEELAISLADKRINQADSSKLVIEHFHSSNWFNAKSLISNENDFLNDFSLKNVSSANYFGLYQDFISMMVNFEVSIISHSYVFLNETLNHDDESRVNLNISQRTNYEKKNILNEINALEAELVAIRNKLKNESQMNTKLALNLDAKKIKNKLFMLKSHI
ncbi:Putative uncharacterized protein [Moritella viscosa]|uniref:DUF4391 domain-containing protein n=1 Tax=Moritella viscosa TaxID=80854 RepID=UPI0009242F12|nr:DUF4391 domain-containing protein [Moritella viscosa]SHO23772.1 Putative uncharacterized protein [Moritella viscosa]